MHDFSLYLQLCTINLKISWCYLYSRCKKVCTVLNSLSPSNNASNCSRKMCYGKISFILLIPDRRRSLEGRHAVAEDVVGAVDVEGRDEPSKPLIEIRDQDCKTILGSNYSTIIYNTTVGSVLPYYHRLHFAI